MDAKLAGRLDDCLDLLSQGWSVDDCLVRYPDDAAGLRPLLATAAATRGAFASEAMPSEAQARIQRRVMAEWDRLPPRRASWLSWLSPAASPRWAGAAAVLLLALAMGSFGTVSVSAGTLPGDALYPVKRFTEETRAWLARSPEAQVSAYSNLVKTRVEELQLLVSQGRTGDSAVALERLDGHLAQVRDAADQAQASGGRMATALAEADAAQDAAVRALTDAIATSPAGTDAELERALAMIQSANARVDAALEALREDTDNSE